VGRAERGLPGHVAGAGAGDDRVLRDAGRPGVAAGRVDQRQGPGRVLHEQASGGGRDQDPVTEMKGAGHPVAGLIEKPGRAGGRPVTPRRAGALDPDAAAIRRHSQVVRLPDYARGACSRPGDRDEDNDPDIGQACRAMAGYERDHAARDGGDLLHGRIGTKRIACGDTARPYVRQGYLGLLADAEQLQPVAAEKQQRGPRGARPQRRPVKDRRYGQRHR